MRLLAAFKQQPSAALSRFAQQHLRRWRSSLLR